MTDCEGNTLTMLANCYVPR